MWYWACGVNYYWYFQPEDFELVEDGNGTMMDYTMQVGVEERELKDKLEEEEMDEEDTKRKWYPSLQEGSLGGSQADYSPQTLQGRDSR